MGKSNIVGGTLLSNIKQKRQLLNSEYEEEISTLSERNNIKALDSAKENDHEIQININDYMNKPIELLMQDTNMMANYFDNNIIEANENENLEDNINLEVTEIINYDLETNNAFSIIKKELEDIVNTEDDDVKNSISKQEFLALITSLEKEVTIVKNELSKKDVEIDSLKKENHGLQQTLMKEQDNIMSEQELENKTLSKVEKLLLDKREELIERQKVSRKNWFLKILDKVKS